MLVALKPPPDCSTQRTVKQGFFTGTVLWLARRVIIGEAVMEACVELGMPLESYPSADS